MRKAGSLLLLPLLALLMAAKSSVPIELPDKIHLAQFTDTLKVGKVLIESLANKKWLVEADTGESITARLEWQGHKLRLRIDYTSRDITFHYLDSEDLGYFADQDVIYIHPNANKFLRRLDGEIRIQVQRLNFEREPAEVVPVDPSLKVEQEPTPPPPASHTPEEKPLP